MVSTPSLNDYTSELNQDETRTVRMFVSQVKCRLCHKQGFRQFIRPDPGDPGPGSLHCWWCGCISPAPTMGEMWRWLEDHWAGVK